MRPAPEAARAANRREEVNAMTEQEKKVTEVFGRLLPKLNEIDKARTLGYLEGMAAMVARPREDTKQDAAKPA